MKPREPSAVEATESVTPNGAERPNRGALNDEERLVRRFEALDLRLKHMSYRAIAAALDVDVRTAHDDVQWALDHEDTEATEQVRRLEIRRIDALCEAIWKRCTASPPDDFAIDRWLHLSARRAKLLGLDAPEKHELVGTEIVMDVVGMLVTAAEPQTEELKDKPEELTEGTPPGLVGNVEPEAEAEAPAPEDEEKKP